MSLYVDHAALDEIAAICSTASRTVGEVAETVPLSVDAGDATAVVLGIVALLMANGGDLVAALSSTSNVVEEANAAYRTGNDELAAELTKVWSE